MKPSLTAFICSTYRDLSEEREAVAGSIRKLQFRRGAMELFRKTEPANRDMSG
jgi:hypothetical protein